MVRGHALHLQLGQAVQRQPERREVRPVAVALAVRAYGIRSTGFCRESPGVKPGRRRDVRFRSSAHRHEHAPVPAPGVEYETAYRLWGRVDEPARRHRTVVAQAESIEASLVGRAAVERRVLVVTQYPHAGRGELALRAGVEVEVEAREVGGPHGRELRTVVRSRTDALDEAARVVLDGPRSVLELVRCIAQLGQGLQQILGGVAGFGGRHPDLCNGACYTFAIPGVLRHSHPQSFDSGATRRMDLRKANAERGSRNAEPSSPPSVPRSAFRVPTLRPRASSAITFTVPSSLASLPRTHRSGSPRIAVRCSWYTSGRTITFTMPASSSSSTKMNPFAVSGRWRATTSPATSTHAPCSSRGSASLCTTPGGSTSRSSSSGWPLAANPSTAYSASSRSSAARPPKRKRSYGWSSASSSWRRPRASPPRSASGGSHSPTCHSSSRRVSPKPSQPPTHTRCSSAVRLSLGGARRTTSPMLATGPHRSRSVTTEVAVSSLQSRMNPSPTRTPPASCPPSPAFHRPLPRPSTVHHTSLTFTSGSRISIPFRLASRPRASSE